MGLKVRWYLIGTMYRYDVLTLLRNAQDHTGISVSLPFHKLKAVTSYWFIEIDNVRFNFWHSDIMKIVFGWGSNQDSAGRTHDTLLHSIICLCK